MESILTKLNGFSTQLTPIAKNIERGLGQARQFAQEKLGTADDLTELPPEYLELERKVDALSTTLNSIIKTYGHTNSSIIPSSVTDTVSSLSKTIRDNTVPVISPTTTTTTTNNNTPPPPTTPHHNLSTVCSQSATILDQEPLAGALQKLAIAETKLGDAYLSLMDETDSKFITPVSDIINNRLTNITKARRNVTNYRLQLDSVKSRFKSATPQRAESLQVDLEKAEDVFVDAVEEATKLMKSIMESPQVLRHIGELVAQHIAYHKLCVQALSELAPEIDEMQMTQQAIYNTDQLS